MIVVADKELELGGAYFKASVKKARARLMDRADEIITKYIALADKAASNGDFESAAKILQFLIEHMPKEEGESIIAESAAKPKQIVESGNKGPVIQIGVQLGGLNEPKQLPTVIDAEPITKE